MNLRSIAGLLCAALAVACTGSSTPNDGTPSGSSSNLVAPHACNPLEAPSTPIALANILGAGRDSDGTLYVVDDGGRDGQRAFISNGSLLERVRVVGSGSTGDESLTVSIADPKVTIRIDNPGPHPTKIGVLRGPLDDKTFEVGAKGEVLEIVGADALAGLSVKNISDQVVEYNASLPDGRRMFVSRPELDWSYEDFRIFFGTPDSMLERPLVSASRGNTTFITFTVDGTEFNAVMPSAALGDPSPPTLSPGTGPKITLTELGTDAASRADLEFICTK